MTRTRRKSRYPALRVGNAPRGGLRGVWIHWLLPSPIEQRHLRLRLCPTLCWAGVFRGRGRLESRIMARGNEDSLLSQASEDLLVGEQRSSPSLQLQDAAPPSNVPWRRRNYEERASQSSRPLGCVATPTAHGRFHHDQRMAKSGKSCVPREERRIVCPPVGFPERKKDAVTIQDLFEEGLILGGVELIEAGGNHHYRRPTRI